MVAYQTIPTIAPNKARMIKEANNPREKADFKESAAIGLIMPVTFEK
jgi:hypothetical protein